MSTKAIVHPLAELRGSITVPGDKSVSQRLAMLCGIAEGTSTIHGYLQSEDCLSTLNAMVALGAQATFTDDVLTITGTGGTLESPAAPLDLGNSGTGIRLLTGLLAGFPIEATLIGDEYLCRRPMERVRKPLADMGADIALLGENGCPPIRVRGGQVKAITYTLPMASAQVKSCVMLAALHAEGTTTVIEPSETRDYTERLFQALGVPVRVDGLRIEMDGFGPAGPRFAAREWTVPGDFSSAAFWIVAAAARPGAELTLKNVGLNPRRTALIRVLERMGAQIEIEALPDQGEPIGTLHIRGTQLNGTTVHEDEIANLIDELPLVAAAGALAEGVTEIRNAEELRVKESDRIASTVKNLQAVGVQVEELPDGMIVTGPNRIVAQGAIDSFGDHRIAMMMSILALSADAPLEVRDIACVDTSYPEFWMHLQQLGAQVEL
ncbi:MAG: 3-phosphoshikimate 1-carboxyvinyltransferase [Kiritimatiellia bacterium]|jgi:3-phosphoshikimate 1-carboxyvinyltransferase